MSVSTGLSIIALLIALWALYWSRRQGKAAEDSAAAAKRSADAAESSSVAATRSAQAAETSVKEARERKLSDLGKEATDRWPRKGGMLDILLREPTLTENEVRQLVARVLPAVNYPRDQIESYSDKLMADWREQRSGA